jgi:hypothetical protein
MLRFFLCLLVYNKIDYVLMGDTQVLLCSKLNVNLASVIGTTLGEEF